MASWDIVETNFNAADETINFGAQVIQTNNLYETSTLATISQSNYEDDQSLLIKSCIHKDNIFLNINENIKMFSDNCSKLSFTANFDGNLDCFCTSNDGTLLLICLKNGTVSTY